MKNLLIAFFSLLTLSFASVSFAQTDREPIGLSVGGYLSTSILSVGARYTGEHIVYNQPYGTTIVRDIDFSLNKARQLSLMLVGSYSILKWLEVEAQAGLNMGERTIFKGVNTPSGMSDFKVSTNAYGAFAVFKFGGDAYVKGKLGLGVNMTEYKTNAASESYSDFGLAFGVAAGQKLGPGSVEIMYMRYPYTRVNGAVFSNRFDYYTIGGPLSQPDYKAQISVKRRQKLEFLSVGYIYTF